MLFKINMDAGHAGASGRFSRLEEIAYSYAFALKVVGWPKRRSLWKSCRITSQSRGCAPLSLTLRGLDR